MNLGKTTPILRIFDEARAREFYLDFLGFRVDWEHRFEPDLPLYMQVRRDDCVLHLTEHHGDCCPGAAVRVATQDVETYQAELLARAYKNARPGIELAPWNSKEMSIHDPFGNRLTFYSSIEEE